MPLTYPVDTNERYCVWETTFGTPYKGQENIAWPADGGAGPLDLSPNLVMLLRIINAQPAHDPATQKLEQTKTADVGAETYTIGWTVVALTAQEQADYADNIDRDNKLTTVGQQVATLRSWATDAAGTTVTNGNNTTVTQTMVTRMGLFFDRFADLIEGQRLDQ